MIGNDRECSLVVQSSSRYISLAGFPTITITPSNRHCPICSANLMILPLWLLLFVVQAVKTWPFSVELAVGENLI